MTIRNVKELPVEGKRVFVRVDFNVPLAPSGGVGDDSRIRAALPTIRLLVERGARIILASHLGRPKGKDPSLSLEPVGARLAELMSREVRLTDEPVGDGARKVVADLREGQIALLENLRFEPGEEENDDAFARQLAAYADIYVNDAFGTAHRAHASTVGMVKYFAAEMKGVGFLMNQEIDFLSRLVGQVERPYVAIIGGAKVSDKIGVLESLLGKVDKMLVGGAMANTFLVAQGMELGKSKVETEKLALARAFLKKADEAKVAIMLPRDVVVAGSPDDDVGRVALVTSVPRDSMALDIGPETLRAYRDELTRARTVFWNGPMGMFEREPFARGTLEIAQALGKASQKRGGRTLVVVGGGDSAAAAVEANVENDLDHVSTGGGASLEFIEGKGLPGISILDV